MSTPDRAVVEARLASLARCVERIRARVPPTADALAGDPDLQDIVSVNLQRAVQLAADTAAHVLAGEGRPPPETLGESFTQLADAGTIEPELGRRLRAAVGFRNIAVHAYHTLDWSIVHRIATEHLDDFGSFSRAVRDALEAR